MKKSVTVLGVILILSLSVSVSAFSLHGLFNPSGKVTNSSSALTVQYTVTTSLPPRYKTSYMISGSDYLLFVYSTGKNWANLSVNGNNSNITLGSTETLSGLNVTLLGLKGNSSGTQNVTITPELTQYFGNQNTFYVNGGAFNANLTAWGSSWAELDWGSEVNMTVGSTKLIHFPFTHGNFSDINVTLLSVSSGSAKISVVSSWYSTYYVANLGIMPAKSSSTPVKISNVTKANCTNNFYLNGTYSNETSCLLFDNGTLNCITTPGLQNASITYPNGTVVNYNHACASGQSPFSGNRPLFSSDINISVVPFLDPYNGAIGIYLEPDSGLTVSTGCQSSVCPLMNNVPLVWCVDHFNESGSGYSEAEVLYMNNTYAVTSNSKCSAYTNYTSTSTPENSCAITFNGTTYYYMDDHSFSISGLNCTASSIKNISRVECDSPSQNARTVFANEYSLCVGNSSQSFCYASVPNCTVASGRSQQANLTVTQPKLMGGNLVCDTGCLYEGKCIPFGYRVSGNYCDITGNLTSQLQGGACDNNFQCSSDLCVNSQCVTESFIQQIINFFKHLFGM